MWCDTLIFIFEEAELLCRGGPIPGETTSLCAPVTGTQEAVRGSAALWLPQEEVTEKKPGWSPGRKKQATSEVHLKVMTEEPPVESLLRLSGGEPSIPQPPFPVIPLIFKSSSI